MIPLHLRLKGFLSYQEAVELDFSGFNLACISGHNGAGKSSLLDAITWALFGQARKRDDSVINARAKTAEVTFDFEYENNTYRIVRAKPRDKTGLLEFMVQTQSADGQAAGWKSLTEKSLRDTEARIQHILHMDYDTFINASFFLQGRADQFSQQRPGDRKRILSSILGLDAWEDYRERAAQKRKGAENSIASLDGQAREIRAELEEAPQRRARLAELEAEVERLAGARRTQGELVDNLRRLAAALAEQKRMVDTLRAAYEGASLTLDRTAQLLAAREAEMTVTAARLAHAAEIEAAYQNWQAAREALQRWDSLAQQFHEHDQARAGWVLAVETARSRLEQERLSLQKEQAAAGLAEREAESAAARLQTLEAELSGLRERMQEKEQHENALRETHQAQAELKAENQRLREEMDELRRRLDRVTEAGVGDCPVCGRPLAVEDIGRLQEELNQAGQQRGDRYRANQARLGELQEQAKACEQALAALAAVENELRRQERAEGQLSLVMTQQRRTVEEWQAGGAPRLAELERRLAENAVEPEIQEQIAALDAQLLALGYDAAAHEAARQMELAGRSAEAELRDLEAARSALTPLEREVAGLRTQREAQSAEKERAEAAYRQAEEAFRAAAAMPDLNQAEQQLYALQEQENRQRMALGGARQKVEVLAQLNARLDDLRGQTEGLNRLVMRCKMLERAFSKDGVPALLIEQALPEIEVQANELLDRLSGGSMSVRFATQKDYKDKNREDKKETLDILISDENGTRDYEMFSGGEAFRVNFAIRLALSRVLAQRAGARLQTLVIDEGFGSQDALGRQRLVEAISTVQGDFAKILVITHLDELKEAFPTRIEVEKTPTGSSVRVV
ncbi:MAG TPA: SMC family ATPase [Anaerolineaceae bacterium]|nr:SMC family ATPase [Anaerolineaceae bacterium]HPN51247.1 SMC family ATPase [Anaerolineaceae bacterium]